MKRVVDGVAYNTETSTRLARAEWSDRDDRGREQEITAVLYETQKGAFFLHKTTMWEGKDSYKDREQKQQHEFLPMTSDEAKNWMLEGDTEVIHDRFAEGIPEAEAEPEQGATIYIRVPATLKQRVEQAAEAQGLSVNALALKCLERCLEPPPGQLPKQNSGAAGPTTFRRI